MRSLRRLAAVLSCLTTVLVAGVGVASAATGPDVSAWQHPHNQPINWRAVQAAGHSFAFIKGTEGTDYVNPWLSRDRTAARAAGLATGSYHFAQPGRPVKASALTQARFYVAQTGKHDSPGDMAPVLDLEVSGGLSGPQVVDWAATWLHEVQRLTGRQPIIYTFPHFWRTAMWNSAALRHYPLWLASYTKATKVHVPGHWRGWSLWQYTDRGRVPGIPTPADISTGSIARLVVPKPAGPPAGSPIGNVDEVSQGPDGIRVRGWALDPDTGKPVSVRTYVDGNRQQRLPADQPSADIAKAHPGKGDRHRFTTLVQADAGKHVVCVVADNVGRGKDQVVGCESLTVRARPYGELDVVRQHPGGARVAGWAVDPNTTGAVPVHVYVDGHLVDQTSADDVRADIAAAHPAYGDRHGFAVDVPITPGATHKVCAYAINLGNGSGNPALGCRTLHTATKPGGHLDGVAKTADGLYVRGWSVDRDTNMPVWVHAYVDGHFVRAVWAYKPRPDIRDAYHGYGTFHGFETVLPWPKDGKSHRLCLYPINAGAGSGHSSLGCHVF